MSTGCTTLEQTSGRDINSQPCQCQWWEPSLSQITINIRRWRDEVCDAGCTQWRQLQGAAMCDSQEHLVQSWSWGWPHHKLTPALIISSLRGVELMMPGVLSLVFVLLHSPGTSSHQQPMTSFRCCILSWTLTRLKNYERLELDSLLSLSLFKFKVEFEFDFISRIIYIGW